MKWDELLKLIIPLAIAISASLAGGNKLSTDKIAKYDTEIVELQKDMIRLNAEIDILKFMVKHNGE